MVNVQRGVVRSMARLPKRALRRIAGEPLVIDGRTFDLQLHAFAAQAQKRQPDQSGAEMSPDEMRAGFRALATMSGPEPVESVAVHDRSIPGPAGELPVRVYHPASAEGTAPGIVWYHQGGGVIGDLDTDHPLCTQLADTAGAVVVSVDYRLGPEHRFPAGVDDAVAAHQWVLDNAEGLGIDPARVAVAGTSQGGTLAAVVCQERRRRGDPQPAAQILLYPGTDQTATGGSRDSCSESFPLSAATLDFFAEHYLPDRSAASDHRASPGLTDEVWGLAPAVVVTAGFDPLRDQGEAYARKLDDAGVPVVHRCEDELCHSFTLLAGLSKTARSACARIADDVAAAIGDAGG